MRLFAIVLFVLHCACSSTVIAMTPAEKNTQCVSLARGAWSYAYDTEAESLAQLYLDKAGLGYVPVVCLGHPPLGYTVFAQAQEISVSAQSYLFIHINAEMRLELFDELRGLIAHEVAHQVLPESRLCGKYYLDRKYDMYTTCEHTVDALGESWGRKGDVRRALIFLVQYIQRTDAGSSSEGGLLLDLLDRRIKLLE